MSTHNGSDGAGGVVGFILPDTDSPTQTGVDGSQTRLMSATRIPHIVPSWFVM